MPSITRSSRTSSSACSDRVLRSQSKNTRSRRRCDTSPARCMSCNDLMFAARRIVCSRCSFQADRVQTLRKLSKIKESPLESQNEAVENVETIVENVEETVMVEENVEDSIVETVKDTTVAKENAAPAEITLCPNDDLLIRYIRHIVKRPSMYWIHGKPQWFGDCLPNSSVTCYRFFDAEELDVFYLSVKNQLKVEGHKLVQHVLGKICIDPFNIKKMDEAKKIYGQLDKDDEVRISDKKTHSLKEWSGMVDRMIDMERSFV